MNFGEKTMTLGLILLFCIGTIGMCHIIVDSTIMAGLRQWAEEALPSKIARALQCYQCTGFWCGVFVGMCIMPYTAYTFFPVWFVCGCAGSFLSVWGATYLNFLEAKTLINIEDVSEDK